MDEQVRRISLIILLSIVWLCAGEPKTDEGGVDQFSAGGNGLTKVGDFPFPTNPMNDRAKGYLVQGKVKSAVFNYGNFIEWGDYSGASGYAGHPAGMWGQYTYLPNVSFLAGVPGKDYASNYEWIAGNEIGGDKQIWESSEVYSAWYAGGDTNFVTILFEDFEESGVVGTQVEGEYEITGKNQWWIDNITSTVYICLAMDVDPNNANAYGDSDEKKGIGLVYPWAYRPALEYRTDEYDKYDYGLDNEEWTDDDEYAYYGATVIESWSTRIDPSSQTDWHAASKSRIFTHGTDVVAGDIFGEVEIFGVQLTDADDPYPMLSHSSYSSTWPKRFNEDTGEDEPFWPGWWAEDFNEDLPDCNGQRNDKDCWEDVPGRFISDNDVYMEFDDRWAHRGNLVNSTQSEYLQSGYPMGLRVMAEAHSYGVNYAEDILFVTVMVRNESGDWCAFERDANETEIPHNVCSKQEYYTEPSCIENGGDWSQLCGEAMVMPDGTTINRSRGFDYKNTFLGFYFDADAVSADVAGNFGVHTNQDDFMEYHREKFDLQGDSLTVSMAMIYDLNGVSNSATDIGIVGVQLLDSPLATESVDLDLDGITDIYPGEPLKMTDWHWFDWYNRPIVVERESDGACCAGDRSRPQAANKEEIQFKLMSGDTTNISADEKTWFFHTPHPDTDLDSELNPHSDSLEGLTEEPVYLEDPEGLDCVLIMSCGPFDLKVGEEAPFSFTIIFGQNQNDIKKNARFAQIMYNSHYQGYTPPTVPTVYATVDHEKVELNWDSAAEEAKDVVTSYSDFEGYKIYRSIDGGLTWGGPEDKVFDYDGIHVGWKPYAQNGNIAQYDLTASQDENHCIYSNDNCEGFGRGIEISGIDSLAPWINLGSNSGLVHSYIDSNVVDGVEYTYSVTAYDMGVAADYSIEWIDNGDGTFTPDTTDSDANPDGWSTPWGYPSIETSKGTSIHDPNFVTVIPGYHASNITFPDIDNAEEFIIANEGTNGNMPKFYSIVNEEQLTDKLLRFEIQTNLDGGNNFDGIRTEDPVLYVYEIGDRINQLPVSTLSLSTDSINPDSLAYYEDLPGAVVDIDNDMIILPSYLTEYPVVNTFDEDYVNNLSDFMDGIRIRFDNMPYTKPKDDPEEFDDDEYLNPIYSVEPVFADTLNLKNMNVVMRYFNEDVYNQRLNFDYKIEFGETNISFAESVVPKNSNDEWACEDGSTTGLPFKITNLSTGKEVALRHTDKGIFGDGIEGDNTGAKDCIWTPNEQLTFFADSLRIGVDGEEEDFKTWLLFVSWFFEATYFSESIVPFQFGTEYQAGDMVLYNRMVYLASEDNVAVLPAGGDPDNLWIGQYPWQDGDYGIITPKKFYIDGDSWTADMSLLGASHKVTQEEIDQVKVVPNPYIVRSDFNESELVRQIEFIRLPQHCTITIFTVSGEKVISFEHHDEYNDREFWNLRTVNNQEVAPGLYIYAVEAEGKKHIGKFAIVR